MIMHVYSNKENKCRFCQCFDDSISQCQFSCTIRRNVHIRITCPCNVYPLVPHFYIEKTGVCRGIPIFLIFAPKHRLWVLVLTCTHNLCFEQK